VSQNFFGGFKDEESKKKNRKDWIEEMITKSKQQKVSRAFAQNFNKITTINELT
jgi:hypothetical protein